jgi:hypothetical protein
MLAWGPATGQATFEPDDELLLAFAVLFFSPDELDELPELLPASLPDELLLDPESLDPESFGPELSPEPEPPSLADELSLAEPFAAAPAGSPAVELLRLSVR